MNYLLLRDFLSLLMLSNLKGDKVLLLYFPSNNKKLISSLLFFQGPAIRLPICKTGEYLTSNGFELICKPLSKPIILSLFENVLHEAFWLLWCCITFAVKQNIRFHCEHCSWQYTIQLSFLQYPLVNWPANCTGSSTVYLFWVLACCIEHILVAIKSLICFTHWLNYHVFYWYC